MGKGNPKEQRRRRQAKPVLQEELGGGDAAHSERLQTLASATSRTPTLRRPPAGALLCGVVRDSVRDGWLVDLVGGSKGFLPFEHTCDAAAGLDQPAAFRPGQLIVCLKEQATDETVKQRTVLSVAPSKLHSSLSWTSPPQKNQVLVVAVVSEEEHGYQCSLGRATKKHSMKVFVKKPKEALATPIKVGDIIPVTVDTVKKESKLVACYPHCMTRYLSYSTVGVDITKLVPGQLVECRVSTLQDNDNSFKVSAAPTLDDDGVPKKKRARVMADIKQHPIEKCVPDLVLSANVTFCNSNVAVVTRAHLHNPTLAVPATGKLTVHFPYSQASEDKRTAAGPPWQMPDFSEYRDKTCLGRIVAIFPEDKQVFISFLPTWVHWSLPEETMTAVLKGHRTGKLVESARFINADKLGCFLLSGPSSSTKPESLPAEIAGWGLDYAQSLLLRCVKANVAAKTPEFALSQFRIGSQMKCRVLGQTLADMMVFVSLKQEDLDVSKIVCIEDLQPGQFVEGAIVDVKPDYVLVKLSDNVLGRVYKEYCMDSAVKAVPTKKYVVGSKAKLRVLTVTTKPLSLLLTAKKTHLKMTDEEVAQQASINEKCEIGQLMTLVVYKQNENSLMLRGFGECQVSVSYASIARYEHDTEINEELKETIQTSKRYTVGALLKVRVIKYVDSGSRKLIVGSIDLTSPLSLETLKMKARAPFPLEEMSSGGQTPEEVAVAAVEHYMKITNNQLESTPFGATFFGVHPTLNYVIFNLSNLRVGVHFLNTPAAQRSTCPVSIEESVVNSACHNVLDAYEKGQDVMLYLLPTPLEPVSWEYKVLLEGRLTKAMMDCPTDLKSVAKGRVYRGVVKNSGSAGVFVDIGLKEIVHLKHKELTGEQWQAHLAAFPVPKESFVKQCFPRGRLLDVRVLSVNLASGRMVGSMKSESDSAAAVQFEDIVVDRAYPAVVTNVHPSLGVFIKFENSDLSALCKPNDAAEEGEDIDFSKNDPVLAKVLQVDAAKQRIYVGLKASYFEGMDVEDDDVDMVHLTAKAADEESEPMVDEDADVEHVTSDIDSESTVESDPEVESEPESEHAPLDEVVESEPEEVESAPEEVDSEPESVES